MNDGVAFWRLCQAIYTPALELKCEHEDFHATFLELDINIVGGKYAYELFTSRPLGKEVYKPHC